MTNEELLHKIDQSITAAVSQQMANLATKGDIAELRAEFKGNMAELQTELKGNIGELRTEFNGGIAELRDEITELRTELKGEIKALNARIDGLGRSINTLDKKFDLIQNAIAETVTEDRNLTKARFDDHEQRIQTLEHRTA